MRNIAGFQIGRGLKSFTTDALTDLVEKYGPEGTVEVNGIAPGVLVWDADEKAVKVFDGEDFVAVGGAGA